MAAMPPLDEAPTTTARPMVRLGIQWDPPRHQRWTVLFRVLLAVPFALYTYVLYIAFLFLNVASWWAALFTGRVPSAIQSFGSYFLQVSANLSAYVTLTIAEFPSMSAAPANVDRVVTVTTTPTRLSRWSVFFRLVLVLPAALLSVCAITGSWLVSVVNWVWVMFTGRSTPAVHRLLVLVLRLHIRFVAYVFLLTPEQPWHGYFGDGRAETSHEASQPWVTTRGMRVVLVALVVVGAVVQITYQTLNLNRLSRSAALTTCESTMVDWVGLTAEANAVATSGVLDVQYKSAFRSAPAVQTWIGQEMIAFVSDARSKGATPAVRNLETAALNECRRMAASGINIGSLPTHS